MNDGNENIQFVLMQAIKRALFDRRAVETPMAGEPMDDDSNIAPPSRDDELADEFKRNVDVLLSLS